MIPKEKLNKLLRDDSDSNFIHAILVIMKEFSLGYEEVLELPLDVFNEMCDYLKKTNKEIEKERLKNKKK